MKFIFGSIFLVASVSFAQGKSAWTPNKCKAESEKAAKSVEPCLSKTVYAERRACIWNASTKMPADFGTACHKEWGEAMNVLAAKDSAKYPNDCSAVIDDGSCKTPTTAAAQPAAPVAPPAAGQPAKNADNAKNAPNCPKLVAGQKAQAQRCFKIATTEKRRVCFTSNIGSAAKGAKGLCGPEVTQMVRELREVESQKWPNQQSSLDQ